jgi:hypothetical protein
LDNIFEMFMPLALSTLRETADVAMAGTIGYARLISKPPTIPSPDATRLRPMGHNCTRINVLVAFSIQRHTVAAFREIE